MPNTRYDFAENLANALKSNMESECDVVVYSDSEATVSLRLSLDDDLVMIANFRLDDPVTIQNGEEEINFYPVNSVDTHCMATDVVDGPDHLIAKIMLALKANDMIGDIHKVAGSLGMEDYIKGHKDTVIPRHKRKKLDSIEHAIAFVNERHIHAAAALFAVRVINMDEGLVT